MEHQFSEIRLGGIEKWFGKQEKWDGIRNSLSSNLGWANFRHALLK